MLEHKRERALSVAACFVSGVLSLCLAGCQPPRSPVDVDVPPPPLAWTVALSGDVKLSTPEKAVTTASIFALKGTLTLSRSAHIDFVWMSRLSLHQATCNAQDEVVTVSLGSTSDIDDACTVEVTPIAIDAFGPEDRPRVALVVGDPEPTWSNPDPSPGGCFDKQLSELPDLVRRQFAGSRPPPSEARKIAEVSTLRLAGQGKLEAAASIAGECKLPATAAYKKAQVKPLSEEELQKLLSGCGVVEAIQGCEK